jgi:hypothetical protein
VLRLPLLAALVLLLAACGPPEEDQVVLDDEAAQALAQGAQRLASALEDEDGCAAMAEADAVASQARDGVAAGTVPPNVANEVEAVTSELTADIACEPDDLDEDPDDEAEDDGPPEDPGEGPPEDRGDGGRGDGQDRGNGPDGQGPPGHAGGRGGPGGGR